MTDILAGDSPQPIRVLGESVIKARILKDPATPQVRQIPGRPIPSPRNDRRPSLAWGLPEFAAIAQVLGPAILYLPGTQPFRVPLRFFVFSISLFGFLLCIRRPREARPHPAWKFLVIASVYLCLMIFHPATNAILAGVAQLGMYVAVASPLFWAPDYFTGNIPRLARLLAILWALNGASAIVGILQVNDPATWMPAEFSAIEAGVKGRIADLGYRGSDKQKITRPPGLGDAPGAACGAGLFVASMGVVCLGLPLSNWKKAIGLTMGMAGVAVIFLSMVRSSIVVLLGCAVVYLAIMTIQRRWGTALLLTFSVLICGLISLQYATSLGGQSVVDRFSSLIEADPITVYDRSLRMGMVSDSLTTLTAEYPLGAGLGRWGMMRMYFGNESNYKSPVIWAEVQFTCWVLDGGVVLISAYLLSIIISGHRILKITLFDRSQLTRQWGAVIIALSAAPIALMFSWTPFNSQSGMQFWLLIGAFEGACRTNGIFGRSSLADANPRVASQPSGNHGLAHRSLP